jgi:hypothetical protein
MNSPDRLRRPFAALLAGEMRSVGLALVREGSLAVAALVGVCLLIATSAIRYQERMDVVPEMLLVTLPVALLLPWLVWKGDAPFGRAFLWTLPVRRQRAAAAKLAAGALWLWAAVLATLAALILVALATGGSVGIAGTRLVGPLSAGVGAAARVPWATPFWMWLVPFGATLTLYLASSSVLLGLRHPLRWLAGAAAAGILITVLAVNLGPHNPLEDHIDHWLGMIVTGRWGLDFAFTGGIKTLSHEIDLHGPGSVDLWIALPTAGRWAAGRAAWLSGVLLALALALRRHWAR